MAPPSPHQPTRAQALATRRAELLRRSALARSALALDLAVLSQQVQRPVERAARLAHWLRPAAAALALLWPLGAALRQRGAARQARAARAAGAARTRRATAAVRWLPLALRAAPLAARLWRQLQAAWPRRVAAPRR